jgi:hypothetical protein
VISLERELERARGEMANLRTRAAELERQMNAELDRVRNAMRAEIVPYGAYDNPGIGGDAEGVKRVQIPIDRPTRRRRRGG